MEYEADLKKLEGNVEKMLSSLDSVHGDKIKLQADLAHLKEEKKELEEQVRALREEKKNILQRVSGLLGVIEKWEKSPAVGAVPLSPENATGKMPPAFVQGVLTGS